MNINLKPPAVVAQRRRTRTELREVQAQRKVRPMMAELYRRAEARLHTRKKTHRRRPPGANAKADAARILHELEVHQIELELQNAELQKARNDSEALLDKYSDLYDFAPVGYFTLAVDGVIRLVNLTGARLAGIERSRLTGQTFGRLLPEELRRDFSVFLNRIFLTPVKQAKDFELRQAGRVPRAVNIEAQRAPDGKECRLVVMDITERKRVEEKMRVSEVRYRRLFETAHDGVLLLDPVTRKIIDANPFMTHMLGYPHPQLVGKELFEIGLLKDEAASQEMFRKLKISHEVRYENLPLESQDGRHQEVEVVANLYQEDGRAVIQCNIRDITARKVAEQELAEKARLLDLSHDAIIVRDMGGHIRYWNHGAEELYGWSRAEALGKISNVLLHTQYPTSLKQITAELHQKDRWTGELVHRKRNGENVTVLARKTLDRDRQGRPSVVLQSITDITSRKQAEIALTQLAAIVEFSDDAIIGKDLCSIISNWNKGAERIFGYTQKEMVGTSIMRLIPQDRQADEDLILSRIKAGKSVQHFETVRRTKAGKLINVSVTASPIRSVDGKIIGVSKVARDISKRKHAEELLRRSEALFSALTEQVPVGVYVVDDQLRLQQVNPRARAVFVNVRSAIGKPLGEILRLLWPRKVADQVLRQFRHTLQTGDPYQSLDFTEVRRDLGLKEAYEWQIQRVTLPAGEHGVVCFFNNITERKRAEETRRALVVSTATTEKLQREIVRREVVKQALQKSRDHQRDLLKQSRDMQAQLRLLSHQILHAQEEERKRISRELHDEIAQILVGINVHLTGLTRGAAGDPESLQKKIARTQQLVEKSVDVVHRFARELRPTALDDLGLIPALHAFMKEFTARTGLHVHLTAFAAIEKLNIARRTVLYRVAHEALNNVAKHAKATRVEVSIVREPGWICLRIKDDGKSFNVASKSPANGGKRLGLVGMRERIDMVGGKFEIASTPGQGTTIIARIPDGKK